MRAIHNFNQGWLYADHDVPLTAPDAAFAPAALPHTNRILPAANFDVSEYAFISSYRKRFSLPEAAQGRRVWLDFDGVMIACAVYLNGRLLGENDGGYTPFSFDISEALQPGENLLQVRVDSTERPDIPPFGFTVDYLTFGGIYRDVWLRYVEPVCIRDVFVRTADALTDAPRAEVDVWVHNHLAEPVECALNWILDYTPRDVPATRARLDAPLEDRFTAPPGETIKHTASLGVLPAPLWRLDDPQLVQADIMLTGYSRRQTFEDKVAVTFGLRQAVFKADGFYLNGEKIKLRGLNRHQTYPYIGAAAPARLQRKDADILKHELGVNIVRTSHYPQSPHFLQRCDEIGLLVMEEIPGWQSIGDDDWKALSLRDLRAMIERDRNHPSIVLWGVRINESWDDERFYRATNALAHELDPTRQTGGVRNFQGSQFFEDVFTFNDFSNGIEAPLNVPHLVTEFSGHMFPTKTWDQDDRQVEHALRHARIHNQAAGMDNVTGAIGWCMFDYNTHLEFGSGDRVCYHGVMDMWRLPKYAAYFYESQIDPSVHPVLRPATNYAYGDRSDGGKEQSSALVIFSNCEEIEWYLGDALQGRFQPDRATYPYLKHPPFHFGDPSLWYNSALRVPDSRFVGYVAGQAVIEAYITQDRLPKALTLRADDPALAADGADMTRLIFQITDAHGSRLPYSLAVVTFEVSGDAELIGANPFPLVGGQAALYLKARHTPGIVTVRAQAAAFGLSAETQVEIRAEVDGDDHSRG
jgi:beta-galactosidase